ncbi:MAG: DNA polymerase III subunit delta [Acidimicrobiales bacterium]
MSGPPPAVLVKGDDPTLLADAVREATDAALAGEDRSLALEELSGDDLTVEAIVDAARTMPFLTGRRVLVVNDVGRFGSDKLAALLEYLASPEETTSLVFVAGGGQTSQKLVNAVKKVGEVIDAGAPSGKARAAWITEHLRAAPIRLDARARSRIAEHLGEDLGRLPRLVETLVAAYGEGASVGVDEVEPFLGGAGGVAPWDLTDAIDAGDTGAALVALGRLTGAGERHPLVILATLHRHYGALLRLDGSGIRGEQEAAAAVGMAPYPAKKALAQASRLGGTNIGRAITLIAQADLDLRGLKDWPEDLVLEVLVARLSRLRGTSSQSPARSAR